MLLLPTQGGSSAGILYFWWCHVNLPQRKSSWFYAVFLPAAKLATGTFSIVYACYRNFLRVLQDEKMPRFFESTLLDAGHFGGSRSRLSLRGLT
jgi:hypothetical protein